MRNFGQGVNSLFNMFRRNPIIAPPTSTGGGLPSIAVPPPTVDPGMAVPPPPPVYTNPTEPTMTYA